MWPRPMKPTLLGVVDMSRLPQPDGGLPVREPEVAGSWTRVYVDPGPPKAERRVGVPYPTTSAPVFRNT
jgi:hypothetical protein